jgi:two-component system OmpR family sensor kinase
MVLAIVALAAVGLIGANAAGVVLLRSYLIKRVDQQLGGQTLIASRGPWLPPPSTEGRRSVEFGPRSVFLRYAVDGTILGGPPTGGVRPELGTFAEIRDHAGLGPYTVDGPEGAWRVQVVETTERSGYAVVGVSLAEVQQTQSTLVAINAAVSGLILVGIGLASSATVRIGLRPLTRMEAAATEIAGSLETTRATGQELSRRIGDADPHTESGRLGTALNSMLVRIETTMLAREASEERLRRFLADAAHELRTPLTSIQGFAELYRRGGARSGPDLDEAMGAIEAEVGRMRLLVNDVLLLARLDEERPLALRPVDLLEVAAEAVRDAHVRVPTRFVLLGPLDDLHDTFDPVTVTGDEARLRQVATNLITNALQHTPDDAEIVVRVGRGTTPACGGDTAPVAAAGQDLRVDEPVAVVEVADTGPGMSAAQAERVFERLYRVDPSRSRRHGGAGLGLSIVAAIVSAHGGRCELRTAPGAGARFRVLLPVLDCAVDKSRASGASEVKQGFGAAL